MWRKAFDQCDQVHKALAPCRDVTCARQDAPVPDKREGTVVVRLSRERETPWRGIAIRAVVVSVGLVLLLGANTAATVPAQGSDFKLKFGAVHFERPLDECRVEYLDVKIEEWVYHGLGPTSIYPNGEWQGHSVFASALWWRTNNCTGVEETYAQGEVSSDNPRLSHFSIADNLGHVAFVASIGMSDGQTGEYLGDLMVDLYLDQDGLRYPITTFNGVILPPQPGGAPPQGAIGNPSDKQTGLATGARVSGAVSGFASFDMDEVVRAEIGSFSSLQFPK
jgi:hypothetical protein